MREVLKVKKGASWPPPASASEIGGPPDPALKLPDISDLASRLRFSTSEGRIWLDAERMVLLHVSGLAALRKELIAKLGTPEASALLFRIGYHSGASDAALVRKVRPDRTPWEAFAVGPQMHALEGIVRVDPVRLKFDIERGEYDGEFIWRDSSESDAHLSVYGIGNEPACWMQLGYAEGYTSSFIGRAVTYREVECRSMGHPHCRIVGKSDWGEAAKERTFVSLAGLRELRIDTTPMPRTPQAGAPATANGDEEMVGLSPAFVAASHRVELVAPTDTTVLFLGETGVGKERFARRLHDLSPRAKGPFGRRQLLGDPEVTRRGRALRRGTWRVHRRHRVAGGPLRARAGRHAVPRRARHAEPRRAGQAAPRHPGATDRAGRRVGPHRRRRACRGGDQRGISRARCRKAVSGRTFITELRYFPIRVPTVRERRADIPRLIEHFVAKFAKRHGKSFPGLSAGAVNALLDYDYPGNVRELENMVERASILGADHRPLEVGHFFEAEEALLPRYLRLEPSDGTLAALTGNESAPSSELEDLVTRALDAAVPLGALESRLLEAAVARADGNLSLAAKSLGLTRPQLAYRFKKQGDER